MVVLKEFSPSSKQMDCPNPLLYAVADGDLPTVRTFPSVSLLTCKNGDGWTPLHLASFFGRVEVADYLLSLGANVNSSTITRCTPLYLSIQRDQLQMVKFLVKAGADLEAKNDNGWTALHKAAYSDLPCIVKYLVIHNANVYTLTNRNRTPEDLAREYGNHEIVRYLQEYIYPCDIKEPPNL